MSAHWETADDVGNSGGELTLDILDACYVGLVVVAVDGNSAGGAPV